MACPYPQQRHPCYVQCPLPFRGREPRPHLSLVKARFSTISPTRELARNPPTPVSDLISRHKIRAPLPHQLGFLEFQGELDFSRILLIFSRCVFEGELVGEEDGVLWQQRWRSEKGCTKSFGDQGALIFMPHFPLVDLGISGFCVFSKGDPRSTDQSLNSRTMAHVSMFFFAS